tara:strand:- start:3 stop:545 length:543 start_codon:yes stop_codon:yes gene_type:complete
VLKERIQEIFEFTKSESPYRKANKGWINKDIFLDLSPSAETFIQKNEAAKVTLFWPPINNLLSIIFINIIIGSILVFTSLSFAKDRFDFNLFNNFEFNDVLNVDENKSLNVNISKEIEPSESTKNLDNSNEINSLGNDLKKADQKIINQKIDKEVTSIKESESKKDIKILQNKKPKSNFI